MYRKKPSRAKIILITATILFACSFCCTLTISTMTDQPLLPDDTNLSLESVKDWFLNLDFGSIDSEAVEERRQQLQLTPRPTMGINLPEFPEVKIPRFGDGGEGEVETVSTQVPEMIYIVKEGDNLTSISEMFQMSVSELKNANGLTNDNIEVGQRLRIPLEGGGGPDNLAPQEPYSTP